jgi:protein phosphatase
MDCFGVRSAFCSGVATQQFLIADFNRSVHIHHTSLNLDDDSRVFGGSQGTLMIVADGLGPEDCGQRASTVAVDAVTEFLLNAFQIEEQAGIDDSLMESRLRQALTHCQKAMRREGAVIEDHYGMGAEVAVAYVCWPNLYVAQAGQTNCSLLRNGVLKTIGNSAASEIVGGATEELAPVFSQVELRPGDRILVCSTDVRRSLDDFTIASALSRREPAFSICSSIADAAGSNGCEKATVVVACFDDGVAPVLESQQQSVSDGTAGVPKPKREPVPLAVSSSPKDGADRGAERS